jgi:phosphatidylserine decarboxylase
VGDNSVIVSPADGKVVDVTYDNTNGLDGYPQRISIYLSPIDVHVNWIPVDGIVEAIIYYPGKFLLAFLPKSSLLNEHNDIIIKPVKPLDHDHTIKVRQIAGFVARRICTWVSVGQHVTAGQKYGMIKFGSRVDIFLPTCARVQVSVGQTVCGGQTVLGRWTCH